MTPSRTRTLTGLLLALALAGCVSSRASRQADIASQLGNWDEAVVRYMEAVEQDPGNIEYRGALLRAKIAASQAHFEKAKRYQAAKVWDRAMIELQQAVELDPTNQYAEAELANVRAQIESAGAATTTIDDLKKKASGARPQPPTLNPRSDKPISLNFPEPTSIFQIYRALGKAFGINILFDPNLKDQEITLELEDVTAQSALETLMRAAGQFYKVQDEHTIIIAADTPQNRRLYEDLVIQTFFLSNAEVKDMMNILRSLVDAKKIATNEQLNAIILRDTADKVKVAERIIESNDKAKAEVVVDVELMQLDTSKIRDLGMALSQYSVTQSLDTGGTDVPLRVSDLQFLNQSNWTLTIPNFVYNFLKSSTDAQLLARPQLRISEGEKARLVIGDKVPIPVTTFNTSNTVGSNIVPITSFQYQEVGITIEIEPRVHHNKEVTLKVKVEVSNINGFITGSGGQQQPRIGTRTIDSTIRLKDGETNFLAGLIRTDESSDSSGIAGLSEIPILGHLFSTKHANRSRTDIILTLTPHIIRNAEITEEDLLPIWVGTESNITFRGSSPRVESETEGPFDTGNATPEEIQEMMRRRLQRLPRGLREGQQENAQPNEKQAAPQGIDLVPPPSGNAFGTEDEQPPPEEQQPSPDEEEKQRLQQDQEQEQPPGQSSRLETAPSPPAATVALASWRRDGAAGPDVPPHSAPPAADGAAPVRLRLTPQRPWVGVGGTVEVRLEAAAARPVSHLPMVVEFDPALLSVVRVEAGDFLGGTGEAQVLADSSQPGRLVIGASRLGAVAGVDGSGTVATVTFRALAAGNAALRFARAAAEDAALAAVAPLAAEGATLRVLEPGAGPQPDPRPEPHGSV
jgi:general secretion pathway protein D